MLACRCPVRRRGLRHPVGRRRARRGRRLGDLVRRPRPSALVPCTLAALLLLPDGRLPSARWRPVAVERPRRPDARWSSPGAWFGAGRCAAEPTLAASTRRTRSASCPATGPARSTTSRRLAAPGCRCCSAWSRWRPARGARRPAQPAGRVSSPRRRCSPCCVVAGRALWPGAADAARRRRAPRCSPPRSPRRSCAGGCTGWTWSCTMRSSTPSHRADRGSATSGWWRRRSRWRRPAATRCGRGHRRARARPAAAARAAAAPARAGDVRRQPETRTWPSAGSPTRWTTPPPRGGGDRGLARATAASLRAAYVEVEVDGTSATGPDRRRPSGRAAAGVRRPPGRHAHRRLRPRAPSGAPDDERAAGRARRPRRPRRARSAARRRAAHQPATAGHRARGGAFPAAP